MDVLSELRAVWPMLVAMIGLVVWLARLEGSAKRNTEDLREVKKALAKSFDRLDSVQEAMPVIESKIKVFGDMLKPDKLADHYTTTARFQAVTEKDLERLMDAAKKAGVI